ncbi:MAG: hypothetical protein ABR598_00100 [Candidatus Dormibacteria bacterium]
MRTTVTLDDDIEALIDSERARTGESFRTTVNRLLRRSVGQPAEIRRQGLPELPGGPMLDISDASAVLAVLDDERRVARGLT